VNNIPGFISVPALPEDVRAVAPAVALLATVLLVGPCNLYWGRETKNDS